MSTTTDAKISRTIAPIDGTDGRFEWYRYNEDLRIIHDRETDMFHAGSIAKSLGSTKRVNNWLRNAETAKLIEGFMRLREFAQGPLFNEIQPNDAIKDTYGTYIHRLLVNHFTVWVSPEYVYKIALLLDDYRVSP